MKPADFIATIAPAAKQLMHTAGIPASVTIAQAALESGWGASELAIKACNLFGVKADPAWHGATLAMDTKEVIGGKEATVLARWRKYPNWQSCIVDRGLFFHQNPRYAHALTCSDCTAFALAIQAAGYATDPSYAAKVLAVIRSHNLSQFDQVTT
jgi:flagellum-specific peptidoglycan hydrolase FlgJ